jgi:hypothetical protein
MEQEALILKTGIALSIQQLTDAKRIGIENPARVRLLRVGAIPMPSDPILLAAAKATNLISPRTGGITFSHGIMIRHDCWNDRHLIAHELAHTRQYERFGGFAEFLLPYLTECITPPGYPYGPLEKEADRVADEICR